ncbi:MAG: tRNA 2-thiouridine(34) synthase MnmA [Victivallaceae bacterium]|nr:tRNA 2-thiouridine(34) synthase MnmA [Victivallaceae bacterium]
MAMRIAVGMSGGVDSTVTAALLQDAGYDVVGITLLLKDSALEAAEKSCCAGKVEEELTALAARLGIEHHFLDLREEFSREILRYSWDCYARGVTPNPCCRCNCLLKFGRMAQFARELGCEKLATGHYAVLESLPDGGVIVRNGEDPAKNQSYFLALVPKAELAYAAMPLGTLTKTQVRAKAQALGLPNAEKKESQDACFSVPGEAFSETLRKHFQAAAQTGAIVSRCSGRILGRHEGIHRYTIGQRKGLGVALGKPAYVTGIDAASGQIALDTNVGALLSDTMELRDVNYLAELPEEFSGLYQFRYRQKPMKAFFRKFPGEGGRLLVRLAIPASRPAAGQIGAFYDGTRLLGGGVIDDADKIRAASSVASEKA